MPRSKRETALDGGWFSRRSSDRGGQAPALRARKGFSSLCPVLNQAIPNYSLLKVCKTLMSIASVDLQVFKVRRTLMFSAALRMLQIKDLKDLSVFFVGLL